MHYSQSIKIAANVIYNGGVIAYPTEGVFGLGCDPFNEEMVKRILAIKERSIDKGLILIASNVSQLVPYLMPLTDLQLEKLNTSWPGPFTWVIPHNGSLPYCVTGGRDTVAVRVTAHPIAAALCNKLNKAIISTSANRSGKPALQTKLQVHQQLRHDIDYLLPGRVQTPGQASQITDLLTNKRFRP